MVSIPQKPTPSNISSTTGGEVDPGENLQEESEDINTDHMDQDGSQSRP